MSGFALHFFQQCGESTTAAGHGTSTQASRDLLDRPYLDEFFLSPLFALNFERGRVGQHIEIHARHVNLQLVWTAPG